VVDITIVRDKQRHDVKATLDNLPDDPTPAAAPRSRTSRTTACATSTRAT